MSDEKINELVQELLGKQMLESEEETAMTVYEFYTQVAQPAHLKELQDQLDQAKNQLEAIKVEERTLQNIKQQSATIDKMSQSVYSAVFDISDGAHCLPRLKRKINDFELNKKQERLEQLTNLQEDLAKEHNELPMVLKLTELLKMKDEFEESLLQLKQESDVAIANYNKAKEKRINQRNEFVLELLKEKQQFEEKQQILNQSSAVVDNLLKEKESIQVLVDTRKAELVALKEKRKKLEAKVEYQRKLKCNHLEYLVISESDTVEIVDDDVEMESIPEPAVNKSQETNNSDEDDLMVDVLNTMHSTKGISKSQDIDLLSKAASVVVPIASASQGNSRSFERHSQEKHDNRSQKSQEPDVFLPPPSQTAKISSTRKSKRNDRNQLLAPLTPQKQKPSSEVHGNDDVFADPAVTQKHPSTSTIASRVTATQDQGENLKTPESSSDNQISDEINKVHRSKQNTEDTPVQNSQTGNIDAFSFSENALAETSRFENFDNMSFNAEGDFDIGSNMGSEFSGDNNPFTGTFGETETEPGEVVRTNQELDDVLFNF